MGLRHKWLHSHIVTLVTNTIKEKKAKTQERRSLEWWAPCLHSSFANGTLAHRGAFAMQYHSHWHQISFGSWYKKERKRERKIGSNDHRNSWLTICSIAAPEYIELSNGRLQRLSRKKLVTDPEWRFEEKKKLIDSFVHNLKERNICYYYYYYYYAHMFLNQLIILNHVNQLKSHHNRWIDWVWYDLYWTCRTWRQKIVTRDTLGIKWAKLNKLSAN